MKQVIVPRDVDYKTLFESGSAFLDQLDIYLYSIMYKDDDLVILFDGPEGAGKSKIMRVLAGYCTQKIRSWGFNLPDFGVDNIHFDLKDYQTASEKAAKKGIKGWINVLDEGRKVANRRSAMKPDTIMFTNFLSECRSSNQIHFIALPAFHDIDGNIAVWRQKFIVHIEKKYIKNNDPNIPVPVILTRGYFKVYAKQSKIKWCYYHKVKYIYPKVGDYEGRFKELLAYTDTVDIEAYNAKKDEFRTKKYALNAEGDIKTEDKTTLKRLDMILRTVKFLYGNFDITLGNIAKILGINKRTLTQYIQDYKIDTESLRARDRKPFDYDFKSSTPLGGKE